MAEASRTGDVRQAAAIFFACCGLALAGDLALRWSLARLFGASMPPLPAATALAACAWAAVLLLALRRALGNRLAGLPVAWAALHAYVLVVLLLPLVLRQGVQWTAERLGSPLLLGAYCFTLILLAPWALLPGEHLVERVLLLPASLVGAQVACVLFFSAPLPLVITAAIAGASVVLAWAVLARLLRSRLARLAVSWRGLAVLGLLVAACWVLEERARPPAIEAGFVLPLSLARVGGVTRTYDALLTPEKTTMSRLLAVLADGLRCEVFIFAVGRGGGAGRVKCQAVFQPSKGEPAVLEQWEVSLPMKAWDERVLSLDDCSGKTGFLTVSTASPEGEPYHAFLSLAFYARRQPDAYNVLLISLDGVRADHVGCYGYGRATSPWMDRLAAEGVRFARCNAQAPWAFPSTFAMLTGEYPSVLWADQPQRERPRYFTTQAPALAKRLQMEGFHTAAVTGGGPLTAEWGLHQGFHTYVVAATPRTESVYALASEWLRRHAQDKFFLFVETQEACLSHGGALFAPQADDKRVQAAARYDSSIVQADLMVGMLVNELERLGIADRTILIVTSAHGLDLDGGQRLRGGGAGSIGDSLRQSLLHVPLVLRAPGLLPAGRVVEEGVALMDVAPTVLELVGVEPLSALSGVSLKALAEGRPRPPYGGPERLIFSEATSWGPEQKALTGPRFKLVYLPSLWSETPASERSVRLPVPSFTQPTQWNGLPRMRLYELDSDPQESKDVADSHPEIAKQYMEELGEVMARNREIRGRLESTLIQVED